MVSILREVFDRPCNLPKTHLLAAVAAGKDSEGELKSYRNWSGQHFQSDWFLYMLTNHTKCN